MRKLFFERVVFLNLGCILCWAAAQAQEGSPQRVESPNVVLISDGKLYLRWSDNLYAYDIKK